MKMSTVPWWFRYRWVYFFSGPVVTTLNPTGAAANSTIGALIVNGSDFNQESVIYFDGVAQTTTFVNSTRLAAIAGINAGAARSVPVYVMKGTQQSNTVTFTVS